MNFEELMRLWREDVKGLLDGTYCEPMPHKNMIVKAPGNG